VLSHITRLLKKPSIFHCVLVLRVHRLRQLLPLYSKRGFCSHGAVLWTPVLRYNRCATPAKLPFCKCPVLLQKFTSSHVWKKKESTFFPKTLQKQKRLICLKKQDILRPDAEPILFLHTSKKIFDIGEKSKALNTT